MNRYRFSLDKALAAWRRSLEYNRAFSADDLDELEQHLRDQVQALVRAFATDTLGASLINETAAGAFGWRPEEAIGKQFDFQDGKGYRTIIGVVKDFHFQSMNFAIGPMMLRLEREWFGHISAKVRPDDLRSTIARFQETVGQFTPYPFEYQFLDELFDRVYKKEVRLGETFGSFTILALLIASMGMFGLAAFAAEQRTKEVGIRKVLGATVSGLVALLVKNFLGLVGVAFIVAVPLAYFAMNHWLEDFAYRIELGPGIFFLPGVLALAIALLTVSYQGVRAATADPVKSLRYE